MQSKRYKTLASLAYLISIGLLAWLSKLDHSFVERQSAAFTKSVFQFALDWKVWLSIGTGAIIVLIPKPSWLTLEETGVTKVRKGILKEIGDDIFDNHLGKTRITLFSEAGDLRNKWLLFKANFFHSRALDTDGRFIVFRERHSQEDERHTRSLVFYCHPSDPEKCDGLAARAIREYKAYSREDLDDIKHLDLGHYNPNADTEKDRKITNYLKDCKIDNIGTLDQIKNPALHIHVEPVYNAAGATVGALVVDSRESESFLQDTVADALKKYTASLKHTYQVK